MFVGTSHDTPTFAVDAIAQWWQQEGRHRYPATRELFILADGGGSNGSRCRAWKKAIQDTVRTVEDAPQIIDSTTPAARVFIHFGGPQDLGHSLGSHSHR